MFFLVLALLLLVLSLTLRLVQVHDKLRQVTAELENKLEVKTAQLQQEIEARRQAEQTCQESRQELKTIVDNASAVIYLKDRDSRLWLVNREFEKIFKLSQEQIVGKSDDELFPPEIADTFRANDAVVLQTKSALKTEEVVLQADGQLHTYLSLKFPLFNKDGEVSAIGGVATDITERKQLEEELRCSEARFRRIFDSNMIGIGCWQRDGKVTQANNALLELLGYSQTDLHKEALDLGRLTPPGYAEADGRAVREMRASGACQSYEKEYVRRDGQRIPVLVGGCSWDREQGFFFVVDMTERKRLEAALQQTVARLEALHKLDIAILELKRPAAMIKTAIACVEQLIPCQRAAIATFKFTAGSANVFFAATNSTGTEFQLPLTSFASLIDRFEHGESPVSGTIELFPPHQRQALAAAGLAHFVGFPLRTKEKLLGLLQLWGHPEALSKEQTAIAAEVSNQVAIALQQARLYQKVQRTNAELEQRVAERTQQLQEINQELEAFSYSVSHDLRAPLRALQGFATALLEDYGDCLDSLGQDYAQRLISSANNMEQLIQDLLAYSRLSRAEIQFRSVSIAAAIAAVCEQIPTDPAQVTVEAPLAEVQANPAILTQVVSNLLTNALKFVAPGVQPQVRIWSETQGEWVRLFVQDNGIGISEQHTARIFKVFERLHSQEAYPGTGIGLAIVRKGVERLGGRVGLESTVGRGSCFWIELPAAARPNGK
ncbi:MAG: PAS domain S-box protein [Cyanophyceae cyanobacterium]